MLPSITVLMKVTTIKKAHDEDAFLKPKELKFKKQKYVVEGRKKEKVAGFVFGESILNELL